MKALFSILFLSILFISCQETRPVSELKEYDGPLAEAENVDVIYTDSARVKFTLKAPKQEKFRDENEEFSKGVYMEFYDNKEQKESTLKSNYAFFDKRLNRWFVKGDVVLNNFARKRILKSEELYWSAKEQEVWCDTTVNVTVTTEDQILFGKGLRAKDDFSDYEIQNPSGEISL